MRGKKINFPFGLIQLAKVKLYGRNILAQRQNLVALNRFLKQNDFVCAIKAQTRHTFNPHKICNSISVLSIYIFFRSFVSQCAREMSNMSTRWYARERFRVISYRSIFSEILKKNEKLIFDIYRNCTFSSRCVLNAHFTHSQSANKCSVRFTKCSLRKMYFTYHF